MVEIRSEGLFMAMQPRLIVCGKRNAAYTMAVSFLIGPAIMVAASLAVDIHGSSPLGFVPFVFAKEYGIHPYILSTCAYQNEVTKALAQAGLESSNLIVGIDFTKSNEWTGKLSFNKRSLHSIGVFPNPYQQAISIVGRTLSAFDKDNLIPCFGFGDGPTSFAPIIETAIGIVDSTGGQYHVLLVVADGQVTRSIDTQYRQLSQQEQGTVNAIVKASDYPLSIVMVGVGDGP